eukprot:Polyplicarium_translucidae@DN3073_c0_g1_i2.p1
MSPSFAASVGFDHRLPESELRDTSKAADGLRYSLRNQKLYIPPKFRAALLYWFHRYCWWPGLSADVAKYIGGCLPKPALFQMVSLDCVGPREWGGGKRWIVVAIDHCSRFMVTKTLVSPPCGADSVRFLEEAWVPYFGSAEGVLVDRGSEFVDSNFRTRKGMQ